MKSAHKNKESTLQIAKKRRNAKKRLDNSLNCRGKFYRFNYNERYCMYLKQIRI